MHPIQPQLFKFDTFCTTCQSETKHVRFMFTQPHIFTITHKIVQFEWLEPCTSSLDNLKGSIISQSTGHGLKGQYRHDQSSLSTGHGIGVVIYNVWTHTVTENYYSSSFMQSSAKVIVTLSCGYYFQSLTCTVCTCNLKLALQLHAMYM